MKYVVLLFIGVACGAILLPVLQGNEEMARTVNMVLIGLAGLALLVIGGGVAVMLVKLGANITISATNSNDRWDAAKVKAYSDVFRMGASAGKSLPMSQQAPIDMTDIGTGWIPAVEQYRLPAANVDD